MPPPPPPPRLIKGGSYILDVGVEKGELLKGRGGGSNSQKYGFLVLSLSTPVRESL